MSTITTQENKNSYDSKYDSGYGIRYPDGHIIRFYERVLKYEKNLLSGKLLDFGCGNGTHTKFFLDKGYDCYGVDVSEAAVEQANTLCGGVAHISKIIPGESLLNIFSENSFDIIIANQSLYYNDNDDLKQYSEELFKVLKVDGIVLFTMMSTQNSMWKMVEETADNGLSKVVLSHRLHETTYVNFVESKGKLIKIFNHFKPLHIGQYELYTYLDRDDEDGCSHHYMFIGTK